MSFRRVVSGAALWFLCVVPAFGQGFATAEFNGTVADQSGAVLPGATITITEESTGLVARLLDDMVASFSRPCSPGLHFYGAALGFHTQSSQGSVSSSFKPSLSSSLCPSGR